MRITPAYAGKSNAEEKTAELDTGSPPPMRGKVTDFRKVKGSGRITPAYAGKSPYTYSFEPATRDHPRLCGEKFVWRYVNYEKVGSPPPMRGKVPHSFVHHLSTRITPAYAGKSNSSGTRLNMN